MNKNDFSFFHSPFFSSVIYFFRIHIVVKKTVAGEIFPFRTGNAVIAVRINGKTAAGKEFAPYFYIAGTEQTNQVGHNHIDAVFVEITVIPIAEKVELQGFAFYHPFIRNIGNIDGGEIGLPRFRAEAREFRTIELDEIIPVFMLIGNFFQKIRIIIIEILRISAAQLGELVQTFSFLCHRLPRINKILCNCYKNSIVKRRCKHGNPGLLVE